MTAPTVRPRTSTGIRFATSTRSSTSTISSDASIAAGDHLAGVARAARSPTTVARRRRRRGEQPLRLVVHERDAPGPVRRDGPLADAVQHRLVLLEQGGDLSRLEPERLPLDTAREEQRPESAEREAERGRDQDHRQVGAELRARPRARARRRRRGRSRARARRGSAPSLAPSGPASRSGRRRTPARAATSRSVESRLADLLAVGVRVADAAVVRDDDEDAPLAVADSLGDRLDRSLRVGQREGTADLRHLRNRAGDRERLLPRSAIDLLPRLQDRDGEAGRRA